MTRLSVLWWRWVLLRGRDLPIDAQMWFWRIVPHKHLIYQGVSSDLFWCARCDRQIGGTNAR